MNNIQNKILSIYKKTYTILTMEKINYFAIGGTAIGSVRHNGFIPWDDDLDIVVPFKDFIYILKNKEKFENENIKIRSYLETKKYMQIFFKFHNTDTTFIEKEELDCPNDYGGIWVDIMPLCGMPNNKIKRKIFLFKSKVLLNLIKARRCNYKDFVRIQAKIMYIALYPLKVLSKDFLINRWYKLMSKYDLENSEYTGSLWLENINENDLLKREWFDSYIEMPFEDTTMRMPIGYHEMLTKQFGDYMKLPPESERYNHSGGIIDTERPYSFYQEEYKKKGSLEEYLK